VTSLDLRAALSDDALRTLRAHYRRDDIARAARRSVIEPYPPSAGFGAFVTDTLFDAARIAPSERERVVLALLLSRASSPSFAVAIHVYWSLMEGLSIVDVADVVTLTGVYAGMAHYKVGLDTMRVTLAVLRDAAASPEPPTAERIVSIIATRLA
jgi:hypothetical protein